MAWASAPPPNYPTLNPQYLGNAIANLFNNYQQAQQGQQRTQANDLRNRQDQMLLNQQKAFAGGVPMNPDGTPNYSAIMKTLAEKGDINAIGSLAPIIQQEQNIQGANAPDPFFGGGSTPSGGGEGGTAKGTYSLSQMIQMAENAGFQGQDAAHIAAIAMAESSGDPNATSSIGAAGLTQINPHAWSFAETAYDPQQAFNDAYAVYQKQGWGAWSTDPTSKNFTPGNSMAKYLPQAEADLGKVGGAKGTQVASLGDSDVTAYATPETPAIPPASASAGSTIPRGNAPTAVKAVGGAPIGPGMGAPALGMAPASAPGTPVNGATVAWGQVPGQTVVSPGDASQPTSQLPTGPASGSAPRPQTPQAPASPPASTAQGSVASIAAAAGIPPNITANIAKVVGAAPDAPLTPQQADRAKKIIQAYVARTAARPPAGGQGQPSTGGPLVPQFPLPAGFKDPQQAIMAIDQDIARLSRFGPAATGRIRALEDMRDRIAKSSAPIAMHAGEMLVNPATGQTIARVPYANANTMALQAFMEEHPNATAEDIQAFMAAGRGGRGGVTQDKASDIAKAIKSGDQPPVLTGLYGASGLVRSKLAEDGFDLSKHQMEWDAAKKMVLSLNGPQMVRFMGLANSVQNTMNEVDERADEMKNSGIPLMNAARMTAYIQAEGNSEKGQLATRYMEATNALKEELASLVQGGYVPTEAAWKLSNEMVNANYGSEQMTAGLDELQRLIKYRLKAFPGMSEIGPGSANQYIPGGGQTSPPPPATGASSSGPRKISTKADYDALKSGAQYEAPDGSIRTKQ